MQVDDRVVGEAVILKITGEMTLKKSGDVTLQQHVRGQVQQGRKRVLVDLSDVSYIDSAGLGELVQSHTAVKNSGGALALFGVTPRVEELLVLTSLSTVLKRYGTEADALAGATPN
jgi:anti-sigma B factor antagonist